MTTYSGTPGNDTINASNGDTVDISQGGEDTVNFSGGGTVIAGGALDAGDVINATSQLNISLDGDYSSRLTFNNLLLPHTELNDITLGAGYSYDLAFNNNEFTNAFALNPITIDVSALGAGDSLTLDLTAGSLVGGMGPHPNTFLIKNGAGPEMVLFHGDAENASVNFTTNYGASFAISDDTDSTVYATGNVKLQFQDGAAIVGTGGNDSLGPVAGAAAYFAGPGNDTITPGAGTIFIDGGAGTDTVNLSGNRADYTAGYNGNGQMTFTDGSAVVTLANVELVDFADGQMMLGTSGADMLTSSTPGESFFGGAGNDTITGTGNSDTAVYTGARAQYKITLKADGSAYEVTDLRSGSPDGTDTLNNIGYLSFSDGTIAMPAIAPNHPPVVSTNNVTLAADQTVALSSLFSVSDADGDGITEYQVFQSNSGGSSDNGHFNVGGGPYYLAPGAVLTISAAQLAQVYFVTGTVGASLQIRAYDGTDWSAADNAAWSPFTVSIQQTPAPIVTTQNVTEGHNQTLALSSLFTVSDPSGNPITEYQLWQSTAGADAGRFVVNGAVQNAGQIITITAAQLAQTSFVTGATAASLQIRAYDGTAWSASDTAAWSPFTVSVGGDQAPVVTTSNLSERPNQTLALSSLFSVSDPDGDVMQQYQLWESTSDPNAGHFVIGGVAQPTNTVINVTAAGLASASFVTGTVAASLQIRASDGLLWSAADNAAWAPFTISPAAETPPVVTTSNVTLSENQVVPLSSLFSISDADGNAITQYQLWDSNADANSGYFQINGVAEPARSIITISAAQLAQTSFFTGTEADALQIRAYDGSEWSAGDTAAWSPFTVSVSQTSSQAPVVTTQNVTAGHNQTIALSSLFSASDPSGNAITEYQLWQSNPGGSNGYFLENGVHIFESPGTAITISASDVPDISFVTGNVAASLQIRAFDGTNWSAGDNAAWSPFTISVGGNSAPVVTTGNLTEPAGRTLSLSSLFSVSDPDGDAITQYQLWDSTRDPGASYFAINGVEQAAGTVITVPASELSEVTFVTGTVATALQLRASDGAAWSAADNAAWAPFTITPAVNQPPVVTTSNVTEPANTSVPLSNLFSVSDPDGDTITQYQLWDSTSDPSSGHFVVNSVAQPASTVITITAAQLAQTSFVTGTVGDNLQIRAFDGQTWSAGDTAAWAPFHVAVS